MKDVKGFTLIELMVTIVVAGVIIGMAVPSYRNFIASNRLDAVSTEISGIIQFARAEALRRNAPVTFCRTGTATATTCTSGTTWTNWVVMSGGMVVRRGVIPQHGNTLRVSSSLTGDSVVIGGDGLARTGGSLVTVDNGQFSVCMTSGPAESTRIIELGAASRITTRRATGECT